MWWVWKAALWGANVGTTGQGVSQAPAGGVGGGETRAAGWELASSTWEGGASFHSKGARGRVRPHHLGLANCVSHDRGCLRQSMPRRGFALS